MPDLAIAQLAAPAGLLRLVGFTERGAPVRRREVPLAGAVVVLSLGPDLWVDGGWTGSFAAGLYDRPVVTGHGGEQAGLQFEVSPLVARGLLAIPMSELFNTTVALEDVLPGARELTERVAGAPDWAARRAIVDAFAARREVPAIAPEVRHAYARLVATHGAARVEALAAETGWSRRHLTERFRRDVGMAPKPFARLLRFRRDVGMAPKPFARLLRFQRAVALLRAGKPLADAAYACGYADQPHMNRDFRAFLGAPPGALPNVQDPLPVP